MSKVSDRLNELVGQGCLINIIEPNLYFHPAVARIVDENLLWVNTFPNDQSDVHRQTAERIELMNDGRDVAAVDAEGELIAYVSPFAEWYGNEVERAKEDHPRWKEHLEDAENRRLFEAFAEEELRIVSKDSI